MANERIERDDDWKRRDKALMVLGALLAVQLRGYIAKDGASPNRAVEFLRQCSEVRGWNVTHEACEAILQVVLDSIKADGA